jgi:SAM-dependent methyltransferase
LTLVCPVCRCAVGSCAHVYSQDDGIWRFVRPERAAAVNAFVRDYTKIRLAEGRGSDDPEFYRNLPDCPGEHPMASQWAFHRRTFSCFRDRVLPGLPASAEILDLGAGTGWLSNRLAHLGYRPCAIDITSDDRDGLGAARHFAEGWPRVQAEFDWLPLGDGCVDAVIFNASLHYSTEYVSTLHEAFRVLRTGGRVVILESPVYKSEQSGRKMVEERHATFLARYGTRSDCMASIEYLTWPQLRKLEGELKIRWKVIHPWYGVSWALRPWIARWKRRREPSRFPILQAWKTPG